ncbi:unnamed protein product [Moneuplotes crassus]|uniref:Uncharacterized protein n=1 Tax=Euplotes crassus TaxID=5936 RepID=A0AAD2D2D1_EUPCR|nr:unnamed protein product [Moneuplotes crassus]
MVLYSSNSQECQFLFHFIEKLYNTICFMGQEFSRTAFEEEANYLCKRFELRWQ